MKKLVLILGLVSGGYSQVTPCEDYACDSLAVRAILDTNGLSLVSVAMASTRNLEGRINEIKIVDQGIVILPENVGIVTELTRLILFGNNITEIPNSIGKLTNLEYLHLDGNSLDILQDSITLLSNLDTLSLANNQLISLPDSIGKLEKLEYLNLNANTLSEIPDSFGKLINLKNLILYKNEIADLPESIVNVTNLENLRIDENHLCSLSTEIIVWADWYQQDWMSSQICIVPKSITIISPNGGEVWEVGSTQAITWTSTGDITQVNIEWLQDGDALLELSSPILNNLTYSSTVSEITGKTFQIKISDANDSTVYDISDAVFEIKSEITSVYNKSTGKYSINIKGSVLYSEKPIEAIRIYNLYGEMVWDGVGDIGVKSGVYFAKLIHPDGYSNVKFVVTE